MHELEMPLALAGLRVEAGAEEIVAWTMPAVFVHQRHADGNVDQPELGVCGVRRPSVILPDAIAPDLRAPRPRLRAKLTRLWNQIELPQLLTRVDIESAYGAGNVMCANWEVAMHGRVADNYHVADDNCRRAVGDLALRRIDADCAVGADLLHRVPRLARTCLTRRRGVATRTSHRFHSP